MKKMSYFARLVLWFQMFFNTRLWAHERVITAWDRNWKQLKHIQNQDKRIMYQRKALDGKDRQIRSLLATIAEFEDIPAGTTLGQTG